MAYQNQVCFSSVFILIRLLKVKICSRPGGPPPLKCGIIYLHSSSMASQRMNARFNKNLDPFVNLCHVCGHKPTSVLSVSTLWYDGGENVGTTEMYGKTLELEEHFQKAASSAIHLISYLVRFDGSHDRISACDAIDLDIMHTVCVREIGDKPDLSLPPLYLLMCSGVCQSFGFFLPSFI